MNDRVTKKVVVDAGHEGYLFPNNDTMRNNKY